MVDQNSGSKSIYDNEIQELKNQNEQLKKELNLCKSILNKLPAYIMLLNEDLHVSFANEKILNEFGHHENKECHDFLRGKDKQCSECSIRFADPGIENTGCEFINDTTGQCILFHNNVLEINEKKTILKVGFDITERKLAENALTESEIKYRTLYQSMFASLIIMKNDVAVDCNDAAVLLHGVKDKSEIIGVTPLDFAPEFQPCGTRSDQLVLFHINEAYKKGEHSFEWVSKKKNGEQFYVDVRLTPFSHLGENYLQCLSIDVTAKKMAEQNLHNALAEKEMLINTLPVGIFNYHTYPNGSSKFDFFSKLAEEITGINAEELLNDPKYIFDSIHPEDLEDFINTSKKAIETRRKYKWEGRHIVSGKTRWMTTESMPQLLENGEIIWHGYMLDITFRKYIEDMLQQSEEKYRILFEEALTGNVITDKNGIILNCNKAYQKISGFSKDELVGQSLNIFYHNSEELLEEINELKKSGIIRNYQASRKRKKWRYYLYYKKQNRHL